MRAEVQNSRRIEGLTKSLKWISGVFSANSIGVELDLAIESFSRSRRPVDMKIGELTPTSRAVNVKAIVVSKSEVRNVASGRDGMPTRSATH